MLHVSYEDGYGDLGKNKPDLKNVFINNSRSNLVYEYRVSQLAPTGVSRAIRGAFSVVIPYSKTKSQN
jgi:hypothetical protein